MPRLDLVLHKVVVLVVQVWVAAVVTVVDQVAAVVIESLS
jgi:hypothetical protein